jgi:hypothetical protein
MHNLILNSTLYSTNRLTTIIKYEKPKKPRKYIEKVIRKKFFFAKK